MSSQVLRRPASSVAERQGGPILDLALGALIIMAMAGPYLTYQPVSSSTDGSALRQITYILIYVAALVGIGVVDRPRQALAVPFSLLLLLGYCLLSVVWAIDPEVALRRLILTGIVILTIFTVVRGMGFARALSVFRATLIATLLLNYASVIVDPSFGIHQASELLDPELIGNWRGFMMQKNFTGAVCAITVIAFVFDARRTPSALRLAVIAGSLFFLYKTSSKTSLGLLVISIVFGFLWLSYNPRYRVIAIVLVNVLIALALALAVLFWSEITAPLSDPRTLTGRSQIWPVLIAFFQDHWLLGPGYGSFWGIGAASPIFRYVGPKSWIVGIVSGHNGYIDVLTQIGLPGLLLTVAVLILWPLYKLLASTRIPRQAGALIIALLVFCWLHNSTESSLLDRDAIVHVVMMLVLALIEVAGRGAPGREGAPPPPGLPVPTHA